MSNSDGPSIEDNTDQEKSDLPKASPVRSVLINKTQSRLGSCSIPGNPLVEAEAPEHG